MKVPAGKQEVACTSLAVVAWQSAASRQHVGNIPRSENMRLAEMDDRGKDKAEGYAK
jgi:hypothetical protein